jgi:SAM-dependent methyltransferase
MSDGAQEPTDVPYGVAVAGVHHEGFRAPAHEAARLLVTLLGEGRGRRVLDLGCGSGAAARVLVDAGYEVVGLDPSPAMLDLARGHVPEARFALASIHAPTPLPRAVAVLMVGEVVNYAGPSGEPSPAALQEALARVAQALEPGGLLLLDVACHGRGGVPGSPSRRTVVGDRQVESSVVENEGRLTRAITVQQTEGTPVATETHTLVLFDPAQVEAALAEVGLKATRLPPDQAWTQGAPGWHAWQAWGPGFDPSEGAPVP